MRISDWSSDVCSSDLQRHRELVAAVAHRVAAVADALAQHRCHAAQDIVAGRLPAHVVDGLEAVQVDHDQRRRPLSGALPLEPVLRVLLPLAAVFEAGQRTGAAQPIQAPALVLPPATEARTVWA